MKKVLLALDCAPHSKKVAEYVAGVASHVPGCEVFLLVVLRGIPFDKESKEEKPPVFLSSSEVHGNDDHLRERQQVEDYLAEISRLILDQGLPEQNLHIRLKPLGRGIAHDILDEAKNLGCDTIVLGRRNQSNVKALFMGSVSRDVVKEAVGRTVWVVE